MTVPVDLAAFTAAVVARLQGMAGRGELPAKRWSIEGPYLPQTNVFGAATTFTAQVGDSEVTLRRFDVFPGFDNPDWVYLISVNRNDVVIAHDVADQADSPLGVLIDKVTEICQPTIIRERTAAIKDFGI